MFFTKKWRKILYMQTQKDAIEDKMIDLLKIHRDAISADCAARILLFIVHGGVERMLHGRRK